MNANALRLPAFRMLRTMNSRATAMAATLAAVRPSDVLSLQVAGEVDLPGLVRLREAIGLAEAGVRHLQQDLSALRLVPTAEDIAGLDADGYLGELIAELRDAQSQRTDPEAARVASHALTLLATFLLEGRGAESPA